MVYTRYLYVSQQASAAGASTSGGQLIDMISENYAMDNQNKEVNTAGYKYAKAVVTGPIKVTGGWEQYVSAQNIGWVMKFALGQVFSSSNVLDSSVFTHTYLPIEGNLPYFTAILGKEGYFEEYTGNKIEGFSLNATVNEPVKVTIKTQSLVPVILSGDITNQSGNVMTFPPETPFSMIEGKFWVNGDPIGYIKSMTIDVAQALQMTEAYTVQAVSSQVRFGQVIPEGIRKITGKMDMRFVDQEELMRFFGGGAGTLTPATFLTPFAIELKLARYSGDTRMMDVVLPHVLYNTTKSNVKLRDLIITNVDYIATYDMATSGDIKALLTNNASGYVTDWGA